MTKRKDWESDFAGLEIHEVSPEELLSGWVPPAVGKVDAWEAICAPDAAAVLARLSELRFHLVETAVDFMLPVDKGAGEVGLRRAAAADLTALQAIVGQTFQESRFRRPPFNPGTASAFYARWLEEATFGRFDDGCWIAERDAAVAGFVTLRRLENKKARIGLLAAQADCRGLGVGRRILEGTKRIVAQWGCESIMVNTQMANVRAMRFYQRNGGIIESASHRFFHIEDHRI